MTGHTIIKFTSYDTRHPVLARLLLLVASPPHDIVFCKCLPDLTLAGRTSFVPATIITHDVNDFDSHLREAA
jgi:hypothetical protein